MNQDSLNHVYQEIRKVMYDNICDVKNIRLPSASHKNALIADPNYGYITPDECVRILGNLNREYNQALVKFGYGLSKDALLILNGIDTRNLFTEYMPDYLGKMTGLPKLKDNSIRRTKELNATIQNDTIYDYLPCFEKGYLQLNKNRYLYFEIENLQLNNETQIADIILHDYIQGNLSGGGWLPGIKTTLRISSIQDHVSIDITDYNTFVTIYGLLDYSQFHWSEDERFLWNRYTIKHADNVLEEDRKAKIPPGISQAEILMDYYAYTIKQINRLLNTEKLSRAKQSSSTTSVHHKTRTEVTPNDAPKRLVRTIGTHEKEIIITSNKAPKAPSEEYVRHYSVASWSVRGTVRKYKNGKTVYIKEHVHHRHALQNADHSITPVTVKVSKNATISRKKKIDKPTFLT